MKPEQTIIARKASYPPQQMDKKQWQNIETQGSG